MDSTIERMVEEIDAELEKIESHKVMKAAQKLLDRKAKLQAGRRALLGTGNKLTGEGGTRITQAEIVDWMKRNPGSRWEVKAIAEAMGHPESTIRSHLNRGKDERFNKHDNGAWSLRDPKSEPEEEDEDED